MKAKDIALIGVLVAIATVSRLYFNFIPNVQPVTAIIIISALLLGAKRGVIVAVLTTIISNMVLGMGLWTLMQIVAWGSIAAIAGVIGNRTQSIVILGAYSGLSGILYGILMSLMTFMYAENFIAYYLLGLPYDAMHAVGNVVFFALLYPIIKKVYDRSYKAEEA